MYPSLPYHAKYSTYDTLSVMKNYEYTVALPDPALYAQVNNLDNVNILLSALKQMGFDDVYEISSSMEYISQITKEYVKENKDKWPIISSACPATVRLIQVKFPSLLEHLLPIKNPAELAAESAEKKPLKRQDSP
jgi:iron only hydrogenase large subunit-like protein